MSRYDRDSQMISWIQFHSGYSRKKRNEMMSRIEKQMAIEEQLELDGKGTGYYE